jgi:hypothetical protein
VLDAPTLACALARDTHLDVWRVEILTAAPRSPSVR